MTTSVQAGAYREGYALGSAEIERLRDALQKIIDRSKNGELRTSKVMDMRRIAENALR